MQTCNLCGGLNSELIDPADFPALGDKVCIWCAFTLLGLPLKTEEKP